MKPGDLVFLTIKIYNEYLDTIPTNKVYTIKSIDPDGIILEELPDLKIYTEAFKLTSPEEINNYNFPNKLKELINEN